ncbi:MAG: hypothetical protein PF487_00975 [Bacteroidales bacterium]|jgi:hypothetical protein|nr:hypothetical protein [Bacteroidales bacterium]
MYIEKAIEVLEKHNEWRKGDEDIKMAHPTVLGMAIDIIVSNFKNSYNSRFEL